MNTVTPEVPALTRNTAFDSETAGPLKKDGDQKIDVLLWVDKAPRAWNEPIASLLRMDCIRTIHVGFASNLDGSNILNQDDRVILHDRPLVEVARTVFAAADDLVLFVLHPMRASVDALDLAIGWMADDPRIATMSFLSNDAGSFSFPHRNNGTAFGVEGHDEASLTKLLRRKARKDARPVPIQVPDGSMSLVSRAMWEVCGELDDYGTDNLALALADLSMKAAKRGFNSYLDVQTYITVPWDGLGPYSSILLNPEARHALHQRHSHFPANYDIERTRPNSVLAEELDSARAKATGIRVLIDGSALGPTEMGTQLLIMKLSEALAQRDEIQKLVLAVPNPAILPAYAASLANLGKIQLVFAGHLDFPDAPHVDIIHRPYQPNGPIPWDRWRALAKRSIITVQDLIAYRNATYFQNFDEWLNYRDNFLRQVAKTDAVVSISHDVAVVMKEERLPIEQARVHVIENGADARTKDQPVRVPDALLDRGWANSQFLFVLGATYAHKNRDLALRVWARLRAKGYPHKLVMAGASVPFGSTRIEECLATTPDLAEHILTLPDIASAERNWLLANSSLAVYLTAAEGFGQVPFEAARLDVPSLFVSFGPLRELIEDDTLPQSYDLDGLVARAETLLTDEQAARAAIRGVLKNIDGLTWAETARKTVEAYLEILAHPARTF